MFVNKPSLTPSPACWKDPLLPQIRASCCLELPQSVVCTAPLLCTFDEEGKLFLHVLKKENNLAALGLSCGVIFSCGISTLS